jgi:hypothetical protein
MRRPLTPPAPPLPPQAELGDVVYVELPPVGETITAGETFGVVESVKVRRSWIARRSPPPRPAGGRFLNPSF